MTLSCITKVQLDSNRNLKLKEPIDIVNLKRSPLYGMYEYRNDDYALNVTADSLVELHSTIKEDIVLNWLQFVENEAQDEFIKESSQYTLEIKNKLLANIEVERTDNDH